MRGQSFLFFFVLIGLAAEDIPKENPYRTEADTQRGKQLFAGHCAPCHGPRGDGGKGANLARPTLPRAANDQALFQVIRDGIAGTEMPGAWALSDHEAWQVASFVRALGKTAVEDLRGDRMQGERLFRAKGNCLRCHTVGAEGGRMGPALTEVGARRSAAFLRSKLLKPEANIPEGFLQVEVDTKNGRHISGVRLNEDTYSIQLRDLSDNLHSLMKEDLTALRKDRTRTPMPAYREMFSDSELDDMVAYLASLRGDK
jgi:putative heme-binding domain-containing protein